jgi:hypothetical protein
MAMLTATVSGGTGASTYQWQQLISGTWTNVGSNQSTYTSGALTTGTYTYRVVVTQAEGCETASASTEILVVSDPLISINLEDDEICSGGSVTLTAVVTGGAGTTNYQWQLFNGGWTNVGANQASYTTPQLAQGTYTYRVLINQNSGCAAASASVEISVLADPAVTVSAAQSVICDGGTAALTAVVTGGAGQTHYQWQQLVSGAWQQIGADQSTYESAPLTSGNYSYRVIVTQDAGCEVASAAINISVVADPTLEITSASDHTCEGETLTMSVQVTGGAGPATYQWQMDNSGTWVNVGSNLPQYTSPALPVGTHTYRVLVTQNSGCSSVSAPFSVMVT